MDEEFQKQSALIGVGVEKCGTTSLHAVLDQNAGFITPRKKETSFFSLHYLNGIEFYKQQYELSPESLTKWRVDITPSYFRYGQTAERIKETCRGELLVVFLMRHPLKRAFSHYWHDIVNHVIPGDGTWPYDFRDHSFYSFVKNRFFLYITTFSDAIERLKISFGEALMASVLEEIISEPNSFLGDLSRRTGVPFREIQKWPSQNEKKTSYVQFNPVTGDPQIVENFSRAYSANMEKSTLLNILMTQTTFTHYVSQEQTNEWFLELFGEDCKKLCDILGRDLMSVWQPSELKSPLFEFLEVRK